jgi:protoporphyrinogen oxidase
MVHRLHIGTSQLDPSLQEPTAKLSVDVVVVGAGPAGLGAAWRLEELASEHGKSWLLLESSFAPGGLASSVLDDAGFTWDLGGHIIHSHYPYFDAVMTSLCEVEWIHTNRTRCAWIFDSLVPHPVQHNPGCFPDDVRRGYEAHTLHERETIRFDHPPHFAAWLLRHFGRDLCREFFFPYNFKMWAHPLDLLGYDWTQHTSGSRFPNVPLPQAAAMQTPETDERGRNSVAKGSYPFPYPRAGGTRAIWTAIYSRLPKARIHFGSEVVSVDPRRRLLRLSSGGVVQYGNLISTVPLPDLFNLLSDVRTLDRSELLSCATTVVGLGILGQPSPCLRDVSTIYFPQEEVPFHRASFPAAFSPGNVPDFRKNWSVLCEMNESPYRSIDISSAAYLAEHALRGAGLLTTRDVVISVWSRRLRFGYPVPSLGRDISLRTSDTLLRGWGIFSRGRLGGWKYEVSNQDHSFMQGVEAVDAIVLGAPERTFRAS